MTPIIITLTITAIAAIAAMAIIAAGHQTEERPGTIDLTGIRPRRGWAGPSASRVRAEAASWDGFCSVRIVRKRDSSIVRDWWRPGPSEIVQVELGEVAEFRDHADERWQAMKHLYRSAPINELQRVNGCVCPDMDTLLGSCPVHNAFLRPGGRAA